MDGEFACPQCGKTVKLRHNVAGRQARCGFCNALVELPFLPRSSAAKGRRRSGPPRWYPWAWGAISLVIMGLISTAAIQTLIRGERAGRARAIVRLLESSRDHEAAGRLDLALMDLDSALEVAPTTNLPSDASEESLRQRRRDLARRDVGGVVENLAADDRAAKGLGDWLNLVARVGADRDLVPLRKDVETRFGEVLRRWIDDATSRASQEADPEKALAICQDGADLAPHLPPAEQAEALSRFRAIVGGLVERAGATFEIVPEVQVRGTAAIYQQTFRPMIQDALRTRGYLVPPRSQRWADLWATPPYRFSATFLERHVGTYLGTQNRLTRIEARLALSDRGKEVWQTAPNVSTHVPVARPSSYLSGRLALNQERLDEAEKLLYDDAFSQLRVRLPLSLQTLPSIGPPPHSP